MLYIYIYIYIHAFLAYGTPKALDYDLTIIHTPSYQYKVPLGGDLSLGGYKFTLLGN